MLITCQRFGDRFLFGLVWPYSSNQKNIMKVGSKSLLLTCSSNKLWAYLYYVFLIRRESLIFITAILVCCIFGHTSPKNVSDRLGLHTALLYFRNVLRIEFFVSHCHLKHNFSPRLNIERFLRWWQKLGFWLFFCWFLLEIGESTLIICLLSKKVQIFKIEFLIRFT